MTSIINSTHFPSRFFGDKSALVYRRPGKLQRTSKTRLRFFMRKPNLRTARKKEKSARQLVPSKNRHLADGENLAPSFGVARHRRSGPARRLELLTLIDRNFNQKIRVNEYDQIPLPSAPGTRFAH